MISSNTTTTTLVIFLSNFVCPDAKFAQCLYYTPKTSIQVGTPAWVYYIQFEHLNFYRLLLFQSQLLVASQFYCLCECHLAFLLLYEPLSPLRRILAGVVGSSNPDTLHIGRMVDRADNV